MKTTAITLMLAAGMASGQLVVEYSNDFTATEGTTPEDYVLDLGFESVGNGDEGSGYFDASRGALVVQAYGSRQVEIGIGSFPLTGVTLQTGTEYTIRVRAVDDLQNWSLGQGMFFGLNDAANRPATPAPFAAYTPDDAFNQVLLPGNNDFIEGPFQDLEWSFTPAMTMTDPFFVFGTDASDVAIFLDSRLRLYSVEITSGQSTGGFPGCNIADTAEPYGVLDLNDISAFVSNFTGGCP